MKEAETYRIEIEDGRVTLKTASFKAEKGSVLHSGIFNKELASSFVAAVAAAAVLAFFAINYEPGIIHYVISALIFAAVFPLCRTYLFKEPSLETVFDKGSKSVSIILRRPLGKKVIKRPLQSLRDIKISHVRLEPENPDAIAFVKKISLQHGTVIPGFGQAEDFFNVELIFNGERFTILTTRTASEAESAVEKLKRYVDA